jgi:hypothetical protein
MCTISFSFWDTNGIKGIFLPNDVLQGRWTKAGRNRVFVFSLFSLYTPNEQSEPEEEIDEENTLL